MLRTTMTNIYLTPTMQKPGLQHFAMRDGSLIYSKYLVAAVLFDVTLSFSEVNTHDNMLG